MWYLVENVVVALAFGLEHDPGLLEQVVDDAAARNAAVRVKLDRDEFPEPRRVVVPHLFARVCKVRAAWSRAGRQRPRYNLLVRKGFEKEASGSQSPLNA